MPGVNKIQLGICLTQNLASLVLVLFPTQIELGNSALILVQHRITTVVARQGAGIRQYHPKG